jgi:hypothetical protein
MPRNNTWRGFSHSRTRSKQKMDGAKIYWRNFGIYEQ